jgi:hypothetical protein
MQGELRLILLVPCSAPTAACARPRLPHAHAHAHAHASRRTSALPTTPKRIDETRRRRLAGVAARDSYCSGTAQRRAAHPSTATSTASPTLQRHPGACITVHPRACGLRAAQRRLPRARRRAPPDDALCVPAARLPPRPRPPLCAGRAAETAPWRPSYP